jgi:hypothetical protein
MSQRQIERGRAIDRAAKQAYFETVNRKKALHSQLIPNKGPSQTEDNELLYSLWLALKRWWSS